QGERPRRGQHVICTRLHDSLPLDRCLLRLDLTLGDDASALVTDRAAQLPLIAVPFAVPHPRVDRILAVGAFVCRHLVRRLADRVRPLSRLRSLDACAHAAIASTGTTMRPFSLRAPGIWWRANRLYAASSVMPCCCAYSSM